MKETEVEVKVGDYILAHACSGWKGVRYICKQNYDSGAYPVGRCPFIRCDTIWQVEDIDEDEVNCIIPQSFSSTHPKGGKGCIKKSNLHYFRIISKEKMKELGYD